MIKLKIVSFKHGLFWYAACEIPAEEHETLYYDNSPFTFFKFTCDIALCWVDL